MADVITRDAVKAILPDLPRLGTNPTDPGLDGNCVYTDPEDSTRHCIAGEILRRFGVALPDEESDANALGVFDLWAELGFDAEVDAVRFLADLQAWADQGVLWGEAIDAVLAGRTL